MYIGRYAFRYSLRLVDAHSGRGPHGSPVPPSNVRAQVLTSPHLSPLAASRRRRTALYRRCVLPQDYLKLKASRIQEAKDEAARLKADAEAKAAAEKEAEERKMAAIRERTMVTKRFVAGQMTETVSRAKVGSQCWVCGVHGGDGIGRWVWVDWWVYGCPCL